MFNAQLDKEYRDRWLACLLKQLREIKPLEVELDHGALTFTDNPKFRFKIEAGLYNGYPIVTDDLFGALKTLFAEIIDYVETEIYAKWDDDKEDELNDMLWTAEHIDINGVYLDMSTDDYILMYASEEFRNTKALRIHDICGSNYGSGIYVAD